MKAQFFDPILSQLTKRDELLQNQAALQQALSHSNGTNPAFWTELFGNPAQQLVEVNRVLTANFTRAEEIVREKQDKLAEVTTTVNQLRNQLQDIKTQLWSVSTAGDDVPHIKQIQHKISAERSYNKDLLLRQSLTQEKIQGTLSKISPKQVSFLLQRAVEQGDDELFQLLSSYNFDANFQNAFGDSLLHTALKHENKALLEKVVSKSPNPNLQDKDGNTPMHIVIKSHDLILAKKLMTEQAKLTIANKAGITANSMLEGYLFNAIDSGDQNLIKQIASIEPNCAKYSKGGKSSLYYALEHNKLSIAKLLLVEEVVSETLLTAVEQDLVVLQNLLSIRPDLVNFTDSFGQPILSIALEHNKLDSAKILIDGGCDTTILQDSKYDAIRERLLKSEAAKKYDSPMDEALDKGDLNLLVTSLQKLAKGENWASPLQHYAYSKKYFDAVKMLLDRGWADINERDTSGATIFFLSVRDRNLDFVKYLLQQCPQKAKVDLTAADSWGYVPFYYAASGDNLDLVKFLIDECDQRYQIDINVGYVAARSSGNTPIHIALKSCVEIAKYLIKFHHGKINIHKIGDNSETPLESAARDGKFESVKYLLSESPFKGTVVINGSKNPYGNNILHYAAGSGNGELVAYLIDECPRRAELDITAKNGRGNTAIHSGAYYSSILKVFFEECSQKHKADVNIRGESGSTILHLATSWYSSAVKYLLEDCPPRGNININEPNSGGSTPLHCALWSGRPDVVLYLLTIAPQKHLINLNAKDSYGYTPLHTGASAGNYNALKILLEDHPRKGEIDLKAKTKDGKTALEVTSSSYIQDYLKPKIIVMSVQTEYDNPILNHPELLKQSAIKFGAKVINKLIDFGTQFAGTQEDRALLDEICLKPDGLDSIITLAGLDAVQDI